MNESYVFLTDKRRVWLVGGPGHEASPIRVVADGPLYDAALAALENTFALGPERLIFVRAVRIDEACVFLFEVSHRFEHPGGTWVDASRVSEAAKGAWPLALWKTVARPRAKSEAKSAILDLAKMLGFVLSGVAAPSLPASYYARFSAWLEDGNAAEMEYLKRGRDKRLDPQKVLPGARAVVALATPYPRERGGGDGAKIARYALGRDYHQVLARRLDILKRYVTREFAPHRVYTSVDTGPVLERAYAEQAGLGWIGKNGLLISRDYGSYVFLATLWTTLPLAPDAPHAEFCGTCAACLEGCPTRAITRPGWVDARQCISYWTIEQRGEFSAVTPPLHDWIFGCDVCQEVCPWNRFAKPPFIASLGAPLSQATPRWPQSAAEWVALGDAQITALTAQTPLTRAGADGLRRNARALLRVIDDET